MNKYKSYKEIPVWKEAHDYTILVYKLTKKFPKSELFGLTSQVRRASASVPSNIVEGMTRNNTKELIQFLYIAKASLSESEYQMLLGKDLNYIDKNNYDQIFNLYESISKQLSGWIKSLKNKL